jgi:hypothetical protein
MKKLILRSQLQVDASPNLKQQIKQLAILENKSLKQFVLLALARQYPDLEPYVKSDLHDLNSLESKQSKV